MDRLVRNGMRSGSLAFVGVLLVAASLATAHHCFKFQVGNTCAEWDCPCTAKTSNETCTGSVTQLRGTSGVGRCTLYVGGQTVGARYGAIVSEGCGDGFTRTAECEWNAGVCQCTNFGSAAATGSKVDSRLCHADCSH